MRVKHFGRLHGSRSPIDRLAACLVVVVIVTVPGCKRGDSPTPTNPPHAENQQQIDDLRNLPYAGTAPIEDAATGGVMHMDVARSQPGYNLIGLQMLSEAHLIDEKGALIRRWSHRPSKRWEACELLPDGDLLVIGAEESYKPDGTPMRLRITDDSRYLARLGWCGELKWKKVITAHHDVALTADGQLSVLTFKRRRVPPIHETIDTRDDHVTLVDTNGRILAEYSMLEAVAANPDVFPLKSVKETSLGGEPWVDVCHANSIEWINQDSVTGRHPIFESGNFLVCFRHQDCIAIFDWNRRRVVWQWGADQLEGPHDAQVLDNGHILLFDNGILRNWSRAVEMDPTNGKVVWQYRADPPESFLSMTKGSVQRLANGNTLIAESDRGRAIEVTPEGDIVWEYLTDPVDETERPTIIRIRRFDRSIIETIMKANDCGE